MYSFTVWKIAGDSYLLLSLLWLTCMHGNFCFPYQIKISLILFSCITFGGGKKKHQTPEQNYALIQNLDSMCL